jgi:hypothetical protein
MGGALRLLGKIIGRIFKSSKRAPKARPKPKTKPRPKPKNEKTSCKEDCGKQTNPYKKRSRTENEKAAKRERELIEEHKKKLEDYRQNPKKYDNKGTYRNAPNDEVRKKIYEGRIRALEKQIQKHEGELKKLEEALKND